MSITVYNDGDHPAGFIGIRVSVMVELDHRQKYFSFRNKQSRTGFVTTATENQLMREARELEGKWLIEQAEREKSRKVLTRDCVNDSSATAVPNLLCTFYPRHRRGLPPQSYTLKLYYFISTTNERWHRSRVVNHIESLEPTWREMTRSLAKARGLSRAPASWNKKIPDIDFLKQSRKRLFEKYGHLENDYWDDFLK